MIVVGKRPTEDHFSKVSIYNFLGLKKCKKRVYRNDKKNLPWDFWEVPWVGLFPTTNLNFTINFITALRRKFICFSGV